MRDSYLFKMVCAMLPDDVKPDTLRSFASEQDWQENPLGTCVKALSLCPRLNWEAYLHSYPDIKDSGVDPALHFVKHGMHERRRLASWHPFKQPDQPNAPLVSIIIPCRNKALYLAHCLQSCIKQSLNEIEIIVVDDASQDNSLAILAQYANQDDRIKTICLMNNAGTFMARKTGIQNASGRYIMFVDADDYLSPNACAAMHDAIAKGYDIVQGEANIINGCNAEQRHIDFLLNHSNSAANREYSQSEFMNLIFTQNKLPWTLWGKLFLRELCLRACAELEDDYLIIAEDMYMLLAIASHARNFLKIGERVYNYSFGTGIMRQKKSDQDCAKLLHGNAGRLAAAYAKKRALVAVDAHKISKYHCKMDIETFVDCSPASEARKHFDFIVSSYGLEPVMEVLATHFAQDIKFAHKFQHYFDSGIYKTKIQNIGIHFQTIWRGGTETVLHGLAKALASHGYNVTFFINEKHKNDMQLPKGVKLVYLNCPRGDAEIKIEHITGFIKAVQNNKIDTMIYAASHAPRLLLDLVWLQCLGIPVIINYHCNYAWSIMQAKRGFNAALQEAAFRCAQTVTCLSQDAELYLRLRGVNALYCPNPIEAQPAQTGPLQQNIAVIGRLGDSIKHIGDCLRVLREVKQELPWVKMLLIGDFATEAQKVEYYAHAYDMGISDNLQITGFTGKPEFFLKQCGILLSTSYWEAFPMGIAEAQALGLPCVIYDVPIEQARDNAAIINVPQNDCQAAAAAIVALLRNPEQITRLSAKARANAAKYSPATFAAIMLDMLADFQRLSPWRPPNQADYANVINYSAFYSAHAMPEKWDQ